MNTFQSLWHPVGQVARDLNHITWLLIAMSTIVFSITLVLLFLSLKKKESFDENRFDPGDRFIQWTGLYIPTLILVGVLILAMQSSVSMSKIAKEKNFLLIKVTAHQYWWEVEYPAYNITTANEIFVPIHTNIKFELNSKDVIHSFWLPNLQGKIDMLPDHKTSLVMNLDKTGVFRGQCAEFCGVQHALMSFHLTSLTENDFNQWLNHRQKNAGFSLNKIQLGGKEIYQRESCHTCHAVRGTGFSGRAGPDLTHIATRSTLGAGTILNNRDSLKKWIRDPHSIKPFNRMPSYKTLPQEDMKKLLDYLETLK